MSTPLIQTNWLLKTSNPFLPVMARNAKELSATIVVLLGPKTPHSRGNTLNPAIPTSRAKNIPSQSSIKRHFQPTTKVDIKELFAIVVFTSTANFRMFETPEWEAIWKALGFSYPTSAQLSHHYLRLVYEQIKKRVVNIAANSSSLQIVSDGSNNIAKDRVEYVSVMVGGESFYWKSTSIGGTKAGAAWTCDSSGTS